MFGFVWVMKEMFSREFMSTLLIWWNFWKKGHEICHLWAIPQVGTGTQTRVVPIPLDITKMVPLPRQSGTDTNLQNWVGTDSNLQNRVGTSTNASGNPDFLYLCIDKPKFVHR